MYYYLPLDVGCRDGEIRLAPGGPSQNEGRVEICYQNVWGAVYDRTWTRFDAAVACTQLNYGRSGKTICLIHVHMFNIKLSSFRSYTYHWCHIRVSRSNPCGIGSSNLYWKRVFITRMPSHEQCLHSTWTDRILPRSTGLSRELCWNEM